MVIGHTFDLRWNGSLGYINSQCPKEPPKTFRIHTDRILTEAIHEDLEEGVYIRKGPRTVITARDKDMVVPPPPLIGLCDLIG